MTEDQKDALLALRGRTKDGYTDDMVEALADDLEKITGFRCLVIWAFDDMYGFGGDSQMYLYKDVDGREMHYEVGAALWDLFWDEGDATDAQTVEEILAYLEKPQRTSGVRWSRLHGEGDNRAHQWSTYELD